MISSSQRPLLDNTQTLTTKTSMPPVGFEPTISAGERPQTCALDRAASGTGFHTIIIIIIILADVPNYKSVQRASRLGVSLGPAFLASVSEIL